MSRAALLTLLVSSILAAGVQAQRSPGTSPVPAMRDAAHAGMNGRRIPPRGSAPLRGVHHHGTGEPHHHNQQFGFLDFPYYPFDYDEYGTESTPAEAQNGTARQLPEREQRPVEEKPLPAAQVIEIPGALKVAATVPLPPTVFILLNGETLEAQHYMLTASSLSLTVHRAKRTIALDMLDIDATVAVNHDRGIELRIPNDRNEISLSF